jgi:hypothetical protein
VQDVKLPLPLLISYGLKEVWTGSWSSGSFDAVTCRADESGVTATSIRKLDGLLFLAGTHARTGTGDKLERTRSERAERNDIDFHKAKTR